MKEYKTKHDWVGKVVHLELCKRLKFDPSTKRYMHKPESVLENETNKFWDTNRSPNSGEIRPSKDYKKKINKINLKKNRK